MSLEQTVSWKNCEIDAIWRKQCSTVILYHKKIADTRGCKFITVEHFFFRQIAIAFAKSYFSMFVMGTVIVMSRFRRCYLEVRVRGWSKDQHFFFQKKVFTTSSDIGLVSNERSGDFLVVFENFLIFLFWKN